MDAQAVCTQGNRQREVPAPVETRGWKISTKTRETRLRWRLRLRRGRAQRCVNKRATTAIPRGQQGRPLQYGSQQLVAAGISESGAPEEIVWLLNYLFDTVLDGRNAYVCDGVQRALGREPTDFAEFANRIAASGAWKVAA